MHFVVKSGHFLGKKSLELGDLISCLSLQILLGLDLQLSDLLPISESFHFSEQLVSLFSRHSLRIDSHVQLVALGGDRHRLLLRSGLFLLDRGKLLPRGVDSAFDINYFGCNILILRRHLIEFSLMVVQLKCGDLFFLLRDRLL